MSDMSEKGQEQEQAVGVGLRLDRVRAAMALRHMGPGLVAERGRFAYDTLWKILRGKMPNVSVVIAQKLAQGLNVSLAYLVGEVEKPDVLGPRDHASNGHDDEMTLLLPPWSARVTALAHALGQLPQAACDRLLDVFEGILALTSSDAREPAGDGKVRRLESLLDQLPPDELAYWTHQIGKRLAAGAGESNRVLSQ